MKIAFTSKGTTWDSQIDPRFGRTAFFLIFDEEKNELSHYSNLDSIDVAHGAGPKTAQKLFELYPDVLITGNGPGENAAKVIEKTSIRIITGAADLTVKEAYDKYKKNEF